MRITKDDFLKKHHSKESIDRINSKTNDLLGVKEFVVIEKNVTTKYYRVTAENEEQASKKFDEMQENGEAVFFDIDEDDFEIVAIEER